MNPVTIDELMNEPVSNLPTKTMIDAYFDGTKGMHDFSREVMLPILKTLIKPSQQESAVGDTYLKMTLLLGSALVMNKLHHFISIASLTRSLFENWLDLKILAQDTTADSAKRYNEFPEIERYRVAKQLTRFAQTNPGVLRIDIALQQAFHSDPQRKQRIAAAVKTNAKGKAIYPEHWSGKNVRDRAAFVGQEAMYVEVYPLLSWYVHTGATGTAGLNQKSLESLFGFCHSLMQRIFVDATATCAKATKISSIDYFYDWMRTIELKTGQIIVSEQIKQLKAKRNRASP